MPRRSAPFKELQTEPLAESAPDLPRTVSAPVCKWSYKIVRSARGQVACEARGRLQAMPDAAAGRVACTREKSSSIASQAGEYLLGELQMSTKLRVGWGIAASALAGAGRRRAQSAHRALAFIGRVASVP